MSTCARPQRRSMSTIERFFDDVDQHPGGCWIWTGQTNPGGYGDFRTAGRHWLAHRFAFELYVGPIPDGLVLDHLCRVRACVNPDHLEVVTNRENTMRGDTIAARNAAKTHCVNGHAFDAANTYVRSDGNRACRACRRECEQRRRDARAAA